MLWTCIGFLIRSALVLLFAAALRRLPRDSSPAYRHQVLLAGFILLLLFPCFPLFVPEVYIPLTFHSTLQGQVTVQETIRMRNASGHLSRPVTITAAVWGLGFLWASSLLVMGQIRALLLRRRGVALPQEPWSVLTRELATRCGLQKIPDILVIPGELMPQTSGIFRPAILLPQNCEAWSEPKRRAVLLHEFAHIQRRDTVWQLLVNGVTALWWFQPLCWMERRWVRAESEQACDAAVLACGMRPSAYAAELLAVAQTFRHRSDASFSTLPMADSGSLEARLQSILNNSQPVWKERHSGAAILALVAIALACSAASFAKDGHLISKGGVSMRRTVITTMFSGLLASAGLSAAAIGGSVLDPTGEAVLNAKASLYNPDTKARQETVSMANGKFEFSHLPAGPYILRVEKQGFAPILREFNVQQDATVDRGLTLQTGSAPAETASASNAGASAAGNQMRISGEQAQTKLITKVQPLYPVSAKSAHVQGVVLLEAVISAEGIPTDLRVVSSPSDDLSQSALEAVRQWHYSSTLLNGNPVEIVTDIKVSYTLAP